MWNLFYGSSSLNGGTLQQLRNIVNRRNVSSDPDRNFNATEDFFHLVGKAHVVVACLKYFGMDDVNGLPNESMLPTNVLLLPKEYVQTAVLGFVRKYFSLDLTEEEGVSNSDRTNEYTRGLLTFTGCTASMRMPFERAMATECFDVGRNFLCMQKN